jgi:hypothetical protein
MPTVYEQFVAKNTRDMTLELIGNSGALCPINVDAEDFGDNNEQPELVANQDRQGNVMSVRKAQRPAMRTGSFSIKRYTQSNDIAVSILDALTGVKSWANEGTGAVGVPYVDEYCVTMVRTIKGGPADGGGTVITYPKTTFRWSESGATDGITINVTWSCPSAGVTTVGPH